MSTSSILIPSIGLALTILAAATGVVLTSRSRRRQATAERLQNILVDSSEKDELRATILRDIESAEHSGLQAVLLRMPFARRVKTLLIQADASMRLEAFFGLTLGLGLIGLCSAYFLWHHWLFGLVVGLGLSIIPFMWIVRRKRVRVANFERHFPDALDMLTSALRAGLAFSGAIQVVAEEAPDAVAREFAILFEEHRLGIDLREALDKLATRIDSTELRLFVTAVTLQRETGGNLTEILDRTAAVIRDRFRILGDVRTMTAQARLSGLILSTLPLALAAAIFVLAPDYLKVLRDDPIGPYLVATAVTLQVVGYAIMNRIVSIKV